MFLLTPGSVLEFTLRVILGLLFFFQGYDKVVRMGLKNVTDTFRAQLGTIPVPNFILMISTYYSSLVELICGGLLIIGLFGLYPLYFLSVDLILVVGAFSLIRPMWDMQYVFPRLVLLAILLYLPGEYHLISADYLLYSIGK